MKPSNDKILATNLVYMMMLLKMKAAMQQELFRELLKCIFIQKYKRFCSHDFILLDRNNYVYLFYE